MDRPVQLAYENIEPKEYWNQTDHLPHWFIVKSRDGKRKIAVVCDNVFNYFVFYVSRYYPMNYEGFIISWDNKDALPRREMIKWIVENC